MGDLFRRAGVFFVTGIASATFACSALAQTDVAPPARVGRLAFTSGAVSFHDTQQTGWTNAVVNSPLTTGDALWTEPNARSEVSLAGTRLRMAGATELDMLAVDDTQTRLQLPQGRLDVKSAAMETNQPYEIVTPRGTVSLLQPGDYSVEAGTADDPTRLGVRAGEAELQGPNGERATIHAGEVAELTGDPASPQLRVQQMAPPPMPAAWADRDRQVAYDQPPQYLTAGITGYEDLNAYGVWINDGTYGEVWVPGGVPSGWEPYRMGHWAYVAPWGWTWIDDQPWGFAPYHYGRWANGGGRWMWVPPERDPHPVYAPALVAFLSGAAPGRTFTNRSREPVGWFPLGPHEAYVPSYTTNRDYYRRLNRSAGVQDRVLDEHWERAQQRQAHPNALANQRFATVVPASTFAASQPVMHAALNVSPSRLAVAPTAPVAAPSAASLAKPPARQAPTAPGPRFAVTEPTAPTPETNRRALPPLAPRQGVATPQPQPSQQQHPAPQQVRPTEPSHPEPPPHPQAPPPPPQASAPPHQAPPSLPASHAAPAPQQQAHPAPPPPQPPQHPAPQQAQSPHPAPPPQQHPAPQQQKAEEKK
jgi:hypothetical protein